MSASAVDATICSLIAGITAKLDEAASIAKAARTCAESGNAPHAVQILMDFEGPAHEAEDLFKAALAIRRHLLADPA